MRALGAVGSKEAEQESLLLEHNIPHAPFGKAILDCLPPEGENWVVPPKSDSSPEWRDREDLRHLIICSIDPPGIALSLIPLLILTVFGAQRARTLTMHSTLARYPMVI